MTALPKWGLVATIKADTTAIMNFAAHHLELGAHRLHIYLDADCAPARAALQAHPRCTVTLTDDSYWAARRRRPDAHQARQTMNATRAYRRRPGVDWLAHVDVDEFLSPARPVAEQLAGLPQAARTARMRPIEALAPLPGDDPAQTWFKDCAARQALRNRQSAEIYPTFGAHLNGGFLSHVAGKVFVRTGIRDVKLRIHNAFLDGAQIPNEHELTETRLCHFHAASWEHWQRAYRYRLDHGSYRVGLKPSGRAAMTMNDLFSTIEDEGGETALRQFYDEVCTATPALRTRLQQHGLLHRVALDLDAKRARHFPEFA